MISAFVTILIFPKNIAILSLIFMSIGDTAAGLVGRRVGKLKIGEKTVEGFVFGFLACALISYNYKLVPFSWLAARIRDRTLKLGFMENSFDNFYKSLADKCIQLGVNFKFQTPLKNIEISEEKIKVNDEKYDLCFSTIGPIKEKEIIPSFKYPKFEYLGAICVIFELDFNLNIPYWIN